MTAPAIVSGYTQAGNGSNSTTLVINTCTYTAGDLIVLVYVTDADSPTTASPSGSGWSALEGPQDVSNTTIGTAGVFYVWTKTAGSEPGTVTITASNSERAVAMMFAVSGHNGVGVEATYATGTDSSAESNNLTTTVNDCLRISIVGSTGVRTVTTLTGHTLLATHSYTSAGTLSVQYKTIATAGSDTGQTATLDSGGWCTYAFAIKPPSGTTYNQAAAGSLTPTGAITKRTNKPAAGTLTPAGAIVKQTAKKVAGTFAPSGTLARRTNKLVSGVLTPAGAIFRTTIKKLAGVLELSGLLDRLTFDFDQADVTLADAAVTVCSLTDAAVTTLTLADSAVTTLAISDATT